MKRHETWFSVFLAVSLITASCVGGSDSASPITPAAVIETVTPSTVDTPTPPAASASADDLIEAAIAQLDAEVAAGEGPSETFAYDLINSKTDAEGFVTLTICAWTGDTVFDTVRDSLYRTEVNTDGSITANHVTTPVAAGDCVNTQLIETAFDFINEFDLYWTEIFGDPESFATDERTSELGTDSYRLRAQNLTEQWTADDIYFETSFIAGDIRNDAIADILYRRYSTEGLGVLEVAACREMSPTAGTYRDDVLVDNNRSESDPGLHSVAAYLLTPSQGGWSLAGTDSLIWSDCFATGNWPDAANAWRPNGERLGVLPS